MDKLSTNIVKLKGLLTLNSDIKTNKFCVEDYCIDENNLEFMDNMPRVEVKDGLIKANGLYRHGYLLAPVVVENILNTIEQNLDPFQSVLQSQPITETEHA